jgi:hypothetical protein
LEWVGHGGKVQSIFNLCKKSSFQFCSFVSATNK